MSGAGCVPLPDEREPLPERPVASRWQRLEQRMGLDLRSLALFRVGLALLLVWDLVSRSMWLRAFYTDEGVLPLSIWRGEAAAASVQNYVALYFVSGHPMWAALLFVVAGLAAVALLVGWRTRLATVVSWVLLVSLHSRNDLVLGGGDTLLRLLTFWAMFLPLGARWSMDSAGNPDARLTPSNRNERYLGVPAIAFTAALLLMYLSVAVARWREAPLTGPSWLGWEGGEAMVLPLGAWLRTLPNGVIEVLGREMVRIEQWAPLLLLVPIAVGILRTFAVAAMLLVCALIALTIDVGLYPYVAAVAWLAFVPPALWDRLFARWRRDERRTGLTLWFDADCGFCHRAAVMLRTFFLLPETRVRRSTDDPAIVDEMRLHNSWVLECSDGSHKHGFDGVLDVLRRSPWAFPAAWVLGVRPLRALGGAMYRWVANHRSLMGRLIGWFRFRAASLAPTRWHPVRDTLLVVALLYVATWSIGNLHRDRALPPGSTADLWAQKVDRWFTGTEQGALDLMPLGHALRLDTSWQPLYELGGGIHDTWPEVTAELRDGRWVDAWGTIVLGDDLEERVLAEPGARPRPGGSLRDVFPNVRWRWLMERADTYPTESGFARLINIGRSGEPLNLLSYFARSIENEHDVQVREIHYVTVSQVPPGYGSPEPHRSGLWSRLWSDAAVLDSVAE